MIETRRIFSKSNTSISLETLMETVDKFVNEELGEGYEVLSVSYVPVGNVFCACITLKDLPF